MGKADNIFRNAPVNYVYNESSLRGSLGQHEVAIRTEFVRKNPSSHKCALELWHNNILPTMLVHNGGNADNVGNADEDEAHVGDAEKKKKKKKMRNRKVDILLHPDIDETMLEYISRLEANKIHPVIVYGGITGSLDDPGPGKSVEVVHEKFRKLVKDLIRGVTHLHSTKKRTLSGPPLSTENFGIHQGRCKLYGFTTSSEFTQAAKADDFMGIHGVIMDHIFVGVPEDDLPADMRHLLKLLRSYRDIKNYTDTSQKWDDLIHYHVAIMSHSERLAFMINCSDKEEEFRARARARRSGSHGHVHGLNLYEVAVGKMMPTMGWITSRFGDKHNVFTHVLKCFQKGEEHYFDQPAGNKQTVAVNKSALACIRNLATHLRELFAAKDIGFVFHEKHVDLMVMSVFSDVILDFSECLSGEHILNEIITWNDW